MESVRVGVFAKPGRRGRTWLTSPESTGTWHELEQAIALVFEEIADVERALDIEARPQLISRPHGYLGPG